MSLPAYMFAGRHALCFGGTFTAPPIHLAAGTGPKLFPQVVLALPKGAFLGWFQSAAAWWLWLSP